MMKIRWNPRWKAAGRRGWLGLAAVGLWALPALAAGQVAGTAPVTFSKDIAPILQRSCQSCHNPKAAAPMSLITYEEVRPWAKLIKLRTAQREMPPWFIEKTIGIQKFKDDQSLSEAEIAKIGAWVDSGAPQGNPADMPPPRQFASGEWTIGKPDLIVSSSVLTIKAVGPDDHVNQGIMMTGLKEDRYIKAVQFKEVRLRDTGEYRKPNIHHVVLTGGDPKEFDGDDTLTTDPISSKPGVPDNDRLRVTYEVGQNHIAFPDNGGVLLKAGSALWFPSTHTHSSGREEQIRIDVGFTFHPNGYKPKYPQSGNYGVGGSDDIIDLPGGAESVRLDAFRRLPQNAIMTTFEPHMHMSGKRMCLEAIYPDGKQEMINCAGYNHYWVKSYMYEDHVAPLLPVGTMLHVIAWYNNSASNRNTIDPRNWKGWGKRSFDDMFTFLPKMTWLTDEQFKAEVAARGAQRNSLTTAAAQQ